jgi:hypothetical protein
MCGLKLIEWAAQKGRKSRWQLRIALAPNVRNGATVAFSRKTALNRFAPVHWADFERALRVDSGPRTCIASGKTGDVTTEAVITFPPSQA